MKIPMKIKHNASEFFGKPEELTGFKAFKSLLKKDLKRLESELADKPEHYVLGFIALDYTYGCSTQKALVILGDQKGAWRKDMRSALKENPKLHAFADFRIPKPGTLSIEINKGSASPSKVEKQLRKIIQGWDIVISVDDEGFYDDEEDAFDEDDLSPDSARLVLRSIEANNLIKMVGFMDKIKSTAFRRLVLEIERYNKIKTDEERINALPQVHALVKSWIKGHASESKPSSDVKKRLAALAQLEPQLKKYLEKEIGATNVQMDEKAFEKPKDARSLRDASPDVKVVELARKLKQGKGSDSDANFGAVLLWLDKSIAQLENKYLFATEKLFKRSSPFKADLQKVFGGSPLRLTYLEQTLDNKLDKLAELALTLGLISKGWFAKENSDASDWLIKNASAADLERIKNASGDPNTFDGILHNHFLPKSSLFSSYRTGKLMFEQAEQKLALDELRKSGNQEEINEASNTYLKTMLKKLSSDSIVKRIDSGKLMKEIAAWLENASPEEREAVLAGGKESFLKELEDLTGLKGSFIHGGIPTGIGKSDLAYIKSRIANPSPPNAPEEEKAISEIAAITAKQEKLTGMRKWLEKEAVTKKIQAALLDGGENIRAAVITKYAQAEDAQKWQALETALQEDDAQWTTLLAKENRSEEEEKTFATLKEKRQKLEAEQEELENTAMASFDKVLDKAGLDDEQRRDIRELVQSEGSITPTYQAIREIADSPSSSKFSYTTGDDVLHQLNEIEDNPAAIAAIRNNEDMLWRLKKSVVGLTDRSKNQWKAIAQALDLSGELANPTVGKNDTTPEAKSQKVLQLGSQKARILSREERLALKEQHQEVADKPQYWAGKLWQAYKKGMSTDWNSLLKIIGQAQHKGIDGREVLKALEVIDSSAAKAIGSSKDKKALVLQEALTNNKKPSIQDILSFSKSMLKSATDYKQIEQTIKQASVEELLSDYFITPDSLLKENWKKIDISEQLIKDLKRMLPLEKVASAKALIRERIAEAMKTKEGKEILKAANTESFTDTEIETATQELKALSEIEKTQVSETGQQWSTLSSRALQRSAAKSKYLKSGWERTEKLENLKKQGTSKEKLEEEQKALNERFAEVEKELQEKRQLFEERKEQLDGYLQKALNIGIAMAASVVFPGVSFVSGFGNVQAVLTELLLRSGSVVLKSAMSRLSSSFLKGHRESFDTTAFMEEIRDGILEDVTLDFAMDNFSQLGLDWAENKDFLQQEVPIVGDSIALNLFEVEGGWDVVLEESLLEDPLVDGALDFVIDREEQKEEELEAHSEAFGS